MSPVITLIVVINMVVNHRWLFHGVWIRSVKPEALFDPETLLSPGLSSVLKGDFTEI